MKPLPLNDSVMVKKKRFRDGEGRDLQLAAEIEEKGKELSDGGTLKDLGLPDGGNGRRRNPVWVGQDLGCRERSSGEVSSPMNSTPDRDSASTWVREIQCMLMNDVGNEAMMEGDGEICGDFLDVLCYDDDDGRVQSSPKIVDQGEVVDRGEVVDQGDLIDIEELFDEGELVDLSNSTSS
ncbi:hypothetical protein Droror1_Dr00002607 [Drosera rotundifolia]